METYTFSAASTSRRLTALAADFGLAGDDAADFAAAVEGTVRRAIPTWEKRKVLDGGKLGKEIAQPKTRAKISGANIRLETGIARVIPSNWHGQVVRWDSLLAEAEKYGVALDCTPEATGSLYAGLESFARNEFKPRARTVAATA